MTDAAQACNLLIIIGLKVTDTNGKRLTLRAALARNVLKLVSAVILMIGFVMAAWTKRKQALHDILARTYVLQTRH